MREARTKFQLSHIDDVGGGGRTFVYLRREWLPHVLSSLCTNTFTYTNLQCAQIHLHIYI